MNNHSLARADDTGWIQTFTGRAFFPAQPRAEDVHIEDIAAALARQCRFGGHCQRFYSVAEHCVHISDAALPSGRLCGLMHDASEAYLLDIPRPIKPLLAGYRELEDALMTVIAAKYGFAWPPTDEIKQLDAAIITDERQQNMASMDVDGPRWGSPHAALGVRLQFWTPEIASFEFLTRFYALRNDHQAADEARLADIERQLEQAGDWGARLTPLIEERHAIRRNLGMARA